MSEYETTDDWDFWYIAKLNSSGYDSDIDRDLINVFIITSQLNWYEDIAKTLSLDPKYVCLLIEILCNANFCEYGSSPRGAWAIHNSYQENLDKLNKWYAEKWNDGKDK